MEIKTLVILELFASIFLTTLFVGTSFWYKSMPTTYELKDDGSAKSTLDWSGIDYTQASNAVGYWVPFLALGFSAIFTVKAWGNSVISLNPVTLLVYKLAEIGQYEWSHFGIACVLQIVGGFLGGVLIWLQRFENTAELGDDDFTPQTVSGTTYDNPKDYAEYLKEDNSDERTTLYYYDSDSNIGSDYINTNGNPTYWCSLPGSNKLWDNIWEQLLGTFVWVLFLLMINPKSGFIEIPEGLQTFVAGLSWSVCIWTMSRLSGSFFNPTIDLGLRVWGLIMKTDAYADYSSFGSGHTYFWIPLVIPFVGGILAWVVFSFVIKRHASTA